MNSPLKMTDSSQWIAELSSLSSTIRRIATPGSVALVPYQDAASGDITQSEAFNFANSPEHNLAFARCFDGLSASGTTDATLLTCLKNLANGRNTYGAASELLTYLWFLDYQIPFEIQVPQTGADILNPNGSDLDGKFTASSDVFFDVKAFGFQEILVDQLKTKLEKDLHGKWIAVQGSWDVSVDVLQDLQPKPQYLQLLADLQQSDSVSRGVLTFVKRDKRAVQVSQRSSDPYQFAQENGSYPFKYAKQFCRNDSFLLIFAYHPWLGGFSLNTNFANSTSTTCRALARRSFMQFLQDSSPLLNVTKAEASKLLSGIAFLNISPLPDPRQDNRLLRLYLNPNATHPIPDLVVDHLGHHDPMSVEVDRFTFDNY
jgi:hypothetical protein